MDNSHLDARYQELLDVMAEDARMSPSTPARPSKPFNVNARPAEAVAEVSVAKRYDVDAESARVQAHLKAKSSFIGQMGLSPNSVAGEVVQGAAQAYSGLSKFAGFVASGVVNAAAALETLDVTPQEYAARDRKAKGEALPGDMAILNRRAVINQPGATPEEKFKAQLEANKGKGPTVNEMFDNAEKYRAIGADLTQAFDRTDVVHQGKRDVLNKELNTNLADPLNQYLKGGQQVYDSKSVGDAVSGLGNIISGGARIGYNSAKAALSNPSAVAGYAAENMAQLASGAFGTAGKILLGSSNAGYALENFQQGIDNYRKANKGAYPDESLRTEMAYKSAALAGLEHLGEVGQLTSLNKAKDAVVKGTAKQALKNTANATAAGSAEEFATELSQTKLEGDILGKPSTALDNLVGGVIGGLSGGVISGGTSSIAEAGNIERKPSTKVVKTAEQEDAYNTAVASNDPSAFLDKKSKLYDPSEAVSVLMKHVATTDATPEVKAANMAKAGEIVSDLEERLTTVQERAARYSPEAVAEIQGSLDKANEALSKVDPADTAKFKATTQLVSLLKEDLAEVSDKSKKSDTLVVQSALERQLDRARSLTEGLQLVTQESATSNEIATTVAEANSTEDTEQVKASIEKTINLSMRADSSLSPELATKLADDTSNTLSTEQRDHLRAFSEARIAENKLSQMGKVSQEVLSGSSKNAGIQTWGTRMATAIASSNKRLADSVVAGISQFAEAHASKAEAATQALALGNGAQIVKKANSNEWMVLTGADKLSSSALAKNGGLVVVSDKLVNNIRTEADTIKLSEKELKSSYKMKFGVNSVSSVANSPSPNNKSIAKNVEERPIPKKEEVTPTKTTSKVDLKKTFSSEGEARAYVESRSNGIRDTHTVKFDGSKYVITPKKERVSKADVEAKLAKQEAAVADAQTKQSVAPENKQQATEYQADERSESAPDTEVVAAKVEGETTSQNILNLDGKKTPKDAEIEYNKRNLVADFFTQKAGSELGTQRPLATIGNFIKEFIADTGLLTQFYKSPKELTDKQVASLTHFLDTTQGWESIVAGNVKVSKDANYNYRDMAQFLIEDGKLPANVVSAISYAAYSFTAENAPKKSINDADTINLILNQQEDTAISGLAFEKLAIVGERQNVVIASLGQRVAQALGLRVNPNAAQSLQTQLEVSLGARAMVLLLQAGVMQRTTITGKEMLAMGAENTNPNSSHYFLSFIKTQVENSKLELTDEAEGIVEATRETSGILDKLFGVQNGSIAPTNKPVPHTQKTTLKTDMATPENLNKILDAENHVPNYLVPKMTNLLNIVSDETMLMIAGFEEENEATVQASRHKSVMAKNAGLARELSQLKEYIASMEDTSLPLFFKHTIWKQQRVGIETNMVNPQTSKIARNMLTRDTWSTTVSLDRKDEVDNFLARVSEGMGVKTDKKSSAKAAEDFKALAQTPEVKGAVSVLRKTLSNPDTKLTPNQEAVLLAGVKKGGEGVHSLSALVALASYAEAKAKGDKSFVSDLMAEVDGVTNGPMLSHIMLGAANSMKEMFALINKGGFYSKFDSMTEYNNWRDAPGNFDLYETLAGNIVKTLVTSGFSDKVMGAVYSFTGELSKDGVVQSAGRNLVKTPLTSMVFGASLSTAVGNMADGFVDSIYGAMEKSGNKSDRAMTHEQIVTNLGSLGVSLTKEQSTQTMMEIIFTPMQVEQLKAVFESSIGEGVKSTMERDFSKFLDTQKAFNTAAQLTYELHEAVRSGLHDQLMEELMDAGTMPFRTQSKGADVGKRIPYRDFTPAEEKILADRMSGMVNVVNSAYSADAGNLKAGIEVAKKNGRSIGTTEYTGAEVQLNSKIPGSDTSSVSAQGYTKAPTNPGVAILPMLMHGLDSMISHFSDRLGLTLNIHDAKGAGVGTIVQTSNDMNKATWETMLNYSPTNEMHVTLMNTIRGLAARIEAGNDPQAVTDNLVAALQKFAKKMDRKGSISPSIVIDLVAKASKEMSYSSDNTRLTTLENMGAISQYSKEGGAYQVTDENRASASSLRSILAPDLSSDDLKALNVVGKAMSKAMSVQSTVKTSVIAAEVAELGSPVVKSTTSLVKLLEASKTTNSADVIAAIRKDGVSPFNEQLLRLITKTVDSTLVVRLVTPDTNAEELLAKGDDTARAWYVSKDGKQEINVLSNDFKHSAITSETLIHELVHAAVARNTELALTNPNSPAGLIVKDLQALMVETKQFMEDDNSMVEVGNAFDNVHEFISWGMSNAAFQTDVLAQMTYTSEVTDNTLTTGLKAFVDRLVNLLLGRSSKVASSGLEVLLTNVSGLFKEATQNRSVESVNVKLNMEATPVYTSQDILESLVDNNNGLNVSTQFGEHLKTVVNTIVTKLYGPFGSYKESVMANKSVTPDALYAEALATGLAPYAMDAHVAGLNLTNQESYVYDQVEAVMRSSIDNQIDTAGTTYRSLSQLFVAVRNKTSIRDFHTGDWATATPSEKTAAAAVHSYIFDIKTDANGKSAYLARFAAMGMAHEGFNAILKGIAKELPKAKTGNNASDFLIDLWYQITDFFSSRVTQVQAGQKADVTLNALIVRLASLNATKESRFLDSSFAMSKVYDAFDNLLVAKRGVVKGTVERIAKSPLLYKSPSGFVRGAAGIASTYGGFRVRYFLEGVEKMRAAHFKTQHGVLADLVSESRGAKDTNVVFHHLLRATKHLEGTRKNIIVDASAMIMDSFDNAGRDLDTHQQAAITQTFMRTDMQALQGNYSIEQLHNLLDNPAALTGEIALHEQQLTSGARKFYINAAKALGYKMATGKATSAHVLLNAGNIARMFGTGKESRVSGTQAKSFEPIIDRLVSLRAMAYLPSQQKTLAKNILLNEMNRADGGNGIDAVLRMHSAMQDKSKALLFGEEAPLFMKGYLPEIYDPYTSILVADSKDGADLLAQGYRKTENPLGTDKAEGIKPVQHIYTLRDGGLRPRVTGIFSFTSMKSKGSNLHSGNTNPETYQGQLNGQEMARIAANKQAGINEMFTSDSFDPTTVTDSHMVPLLNGDGSVVNYRYMMEDSTKDSILQRDNRPAKLLGVLAGNTFDKVSSKDQNERAVKAMHLQWKMEFAEHPELFMSVGPKSTDPQLREIYRMLPYHTKEAIRNVWGSDGMIVRTDMLDMAFGYRKLSLTDAFDQGAQRNFVQNLMVEMTTYAFGQKAELYVRRGEDIWQAAVRLTKSNLVVRSWSTMTGNLRSNWSQLLLAGVGPVEIAKSHNVAFRGALNYKRDSHNLSKLQYQLDIGINVPGLTATSIKQEIARLTDALNKNPVKPLIDAGLMPTIVEDVSADEDIYSFKSSLMKKGEKYLDQINPSVMTAAKWLLMTEDSTPYQVMSFATQISDFLAKYTLYKHNIEKKDNPMHHIEAVQTSADAFINYDVPAHRMMQYANDSGLIMFSKYYIRIQKIIGKTLRDSPSRVIMMVAAEKLLGDQPTMLDSSMFAKFGNPLSVGAFNYPGSVDELVTMKLLAMPFK